MSEPHGFQRIVGQQVAVRTLRKAVREHSPAHAYAFVGPEGMGKLTTAVEFARALNCLDPRDGDPCGACLNCNQLEQPAFPDVIIWSPDGKNTKIEQMREMRNLAAFAPLRGKWKLNIVEQADTFNEDSANCILKLLEEPPEYLINILLYRSPAAMLPTIRSRCRMVRFGKASSGEIAELLVSRFNTPPDQAEFLAAFSQGCPGTAIRLTEDNEFLARRERIISAAVRASADPWLVLRLAEDLRGGSARTDEEDDGEPDDDAQQAAGRSASSRLKDRTAALEAADVLLSWYGDLLTAKVRGPGAALANSDKREMIAKQAARFADAAGIVQAIDAILTARSAVYGNANTQIAAEALMIQLAR